MRHRAFVLCCVATMAAALFAQQARAAENVYRDTIKPRKGVMFYCRVVSEDIERVTYNEQGSDVTKTIYQNDLEYVKYADAPSKIRTAEAAFKAGEYENAIQDFKAGMTSPGVREFWAGPLCLYYIAEANLKLGKLKEAQEALTELNSKYPRSKYAGSAQITLAGIHLKRGQPEEALKLFTEVKEAKNTKGLPLYPPEVQLDAARGSVDALCALKQYDQAIDKLKKVEAEATKIAPDLAYDIAVQRVVVAASTKDLTKASNEAKAIIEKAKREYNELVDKKKMATSGRFLRRALAKCFNVLGDAYLGSDAKDSVNEALVNYMWVVALFDDAPEEHAKALFKAGECRKKLKDDVRSQLLWRELKQRYPGSNWASQVPKEKEPPKENEPGK